MSTHEHLSAASNDRKSRLAQLKSLKRKQAPSDDTPSPSASTEPSTSLTPTTQEEPSVTSTYLSGRNFDPSTRNLKLGFSHSPITTPESTLEYKASQLALQTQQLAQQDTEGEPLDLFRLQPKKPNWDLKRDLESKMREGGLEGKTLSAVARLVRERVEGQRRDREGRQGDEGEGVEVGLEGGELVEAMHQREVEEERERAREDEDVEG